LAASEPIREPIPAAPATTRPQSARQPAAPAAVQQAIEEVNHIIKTLQETLEGMDEVLETLELAERQKTADEQEIESLLRGLRQLRQPRDLPRSSARPSESHS
jgi:hypothetical protein